MQKNSIPKKYKNLVTQINNLEDKFKTFTDNDLKAQNFKLKKQYQESKDLNLLISESFALTREASLRTLGLRHFDVQLIGGLTLNNQKIAEMKTGEGKTLVATLSASLNALTGKGVHIITINDYLANRDHASMSQIYRTLGLNTGLIQDNMSKLERKQSYNADITYVTNYEVTFDFLRDNMALNLKDVTLRPFNYCIIDEVDSVLIDEAQTPLILSDNFEAPVDKYMITAEIIQYLKRNVDYTVDEKNKNIVLLDAGSRRIEQILKIQDLYNPRDPWIPYIINAIKADSLFTNNVHYIIQNNRIVIVDEFTGRIMPDRRWGDGLHQAIEAKEKLPIRQKTETVASITYQNFFLLYPKLSGMTGTGKTAETEFEKIYNLSVVPIPTAKPNSRKDLSDFIYKDELAKWKAIAKECQTRNLSEQPVLVGTTSVEKSEILSQLLTDYNLPHQILNAKPENVKKESEIIAQAGKKGSITIATNMAGRGTDIILGGNIKFEVQKELYDYLLVIKSYQKLILNDSFISTLIQNNDSNSDSLKSGINNLLNSEKFLKLTSVQLLQCLNKLETLEIEPNTYQFHIKIIFNILFECLSQQQKIDNNLIKKLGGLYIIGTERHDSKRIDDQLRGRCGRQGDPGLSRFFLSLDDSLLRIFGSKQIQEYMNNELLDDVPLESDILTKSLNSAQKTVENRNYDSRKYIFDYDEVLNKQRKVIFYERRNVLASKSVRKKILALGDQVISDIVDENINLNINNLNNLLQDLLGTSLNLNQFIIHNSDFTPFELKNYLQQQFWITYELKEAEIETIEIGLMREIERATLLKYIDIMWKEHLQNMSLIRDAVGWRGYGQRNPLFEYKDEAYNLFLYLIKLIRQLVIYELLNIKPI